MEWTSTKPTVPGQYWYRTAGAQQAQLVDLSRNTFDESADAPLEVWDKDHHGKCRCRWLYQFPDNVEWSGPVPSGVFTPSST